MVKVLLFPKINFGMKVKVVKAIVSIMPGIVDGLSVLGFAGGCVTRGKLVEEYMYYVSGHGDLEENVINGGVQRQRMYQAVSVNITYDLRSNGLTWVYGNDKESGVSALRGYHIKLIKLLGDLGE